MNYGTNNLIRKTPITNRSVFCIASCAKSILNTAIWRLIEKKIIVNIYELSFLEVFGPEIHPTYHLTKRKNLSNHTSGIDDNFSP